MPHQTLEIVETSWGMIITLFRQKQCNSLNLLLLQELNHALDQLAQIPHAKILLLQGTHGYFSTGMDLAEIYQWLCDNQEEKIREWGMLYFSILKKMVRLPQIILTKVEGKVVAGGMGLLAASDLAVASPESTFKLTEMLWGLVPAVIAPFLIRRLGDQRFRRLVLTCATSSAQQALVDGLIDQIDPNPSQACQTLIAQLTRLDRPAVHKFKHYIDCCNQQELAVDLLVSLLTQTTVKEKIGRFLTTGKLPWHDIL